MIVWKKETGHYEGHWTGTLNGHAIACVQPPTKHNSRWRAALYHLRWKEWTSDQRNEKETKAWCQHQLDGFIAKFGLRLAA